MKSDNNTSLGEVHVQSAELLICNIGNQSIDNQNQVAAQITLNSGMMYRPVHYFF